MTTTTTELRTTHVLRALLATTTHDYFGGWPPSSLTVGGISEGETVGGLTLPLSFPKAERVYSCSGSHRVETLGLDCSRGSVVDRSESVE